MSDLPTGAGGNPRPRIDISSEDLASPSVDRQVEQMRQAAAPQVVRAVGAPPAPASNVLSAIQGPFLAGVLGGVLGWAAAELIAQPYVSEHSFKTPWYGTSVILAAVLFVAPFAILLGAVVAGWEGIVSRSGAKFRSLVVRAIPYLVAAGIAGAWVSAEFYKSAVKSATSVSDLHVPRAVAWAIFSAAIGAAIGLSSKSNKRAINGALGGAAGGFIGGFVFDYITLSSTNGIPNRIIGLAITGACVGGAIGLVETARREHWLEIVSGGMAGKQFILYHDNTTIGSSHECEVTLIKDTAIAPHHASLSRRGDALVVRALTQSHPLLVNGTQVGEQPLAEGDLLQMGSTVVRYRSKQAAMPTGTPFPTAQPGPWSQGLPPQPGPQFPPPTTPPPPPPSWPTPLG